MKNYIIEENINFFKELNNSLNEIQSEKKTDEDDNKCLITGEILTDKYVTLLCGHKFNYKSIYNDVYNHKKKSNSLETALAHGEIRCPYCRQKQQTLLPFYYDLSFNKIEGVNCAYSKSNQYTTKVLCAFITTNDNYNINQSEVNNSTLGNVEFINCYEIGNHKLNNVCYCWNHVKTKKMELKTIANKEKIYNIKKKKEIKQQEKEIKQQEKEIKQQEKEIKNKIKNELKNIINSSKITKSKNNDEIIDLTGDNFVISNNIIENSCVTILKTGNRKGQMCGVKISNDCLCLRHYNLLHTHVKK